jgi:hypothetical protein
MTGSAWKKGAFGRIVHMQMFRKKILPSMILPKGTCGAGLSVGKERSPGR